jgi:hypothetical protein
LEYQSAPDAARREKDEILSAFPLRSTSLFVTKVLMLMIATDRFSTILATCALTLAMAATGCSTINRDWNRPSATPAPAHEIDGQWEGSWLSDMNGHHGRLRCLVSRLDDRFYRARFKATYWKLFRFGYTVNLQVSREPGGQFNFQGEADLGWWGGGIYHYAGHATPTNFFSTYKSKYDRGTFQMARQETTAN